MASSGDLDVTKDEVERITKALKDEKFRQLFFEYAQEISDPENRKKYEEEIAQLERNRGSDVVFVNPEPGYVIKTNVDGEKKAFINVCQSDKVAKPSSSTVRRDNGQVGTQWSVPHSLAPGREDVDKGGKKCMVYDCVFHPECFKNGEKDPRFFKLMDETAANVIESNFGVKLDQANMKKMTKKKFMGQPRACVIRTKSKDGPSGETDALKDFNVEYPFNKKKESESGNPPAKKIGKKPGPVEPQYSITHRGHFDMQNFTNAPDSMPTTRPQELVVKIQLPLLKSIASVRLDVFEKQIVLECQKPVSYKLDLSLPYPIDEDNGSAKFDKSKSCLTITLPVLPPDIPALPSFAPELEKPALIEEIPPKCLDDKEPEVDPPKPVAGSSVTSVKDSLNCQPDGDSKAAEGEDQGNQDEPLLDHKNQVSQSSPEKSIQGINLKASTRADQAETTKPRCPSYIFRQDDATVSIIIQVAAIETQDLQKQMSEDGSTVFLKFTAVDSISGDTVPFALHLAFQPQCVLKEMELDVQPTEAVLLLHKATSSQGEWSGFKAGASLDGGLQEKLFLTEDNVREHVTAMPTKRKGRRPRSAGSEMDCGVIKATEDSLVIELEPKVNGYPEAYYRSSEEAMSDAALGTVTDKVVDAVIGEISNVAASLKLDLKQDDSTGSDVSSPSSTPCSPSGLRSVLKDGTHYRRSQRSVSFSEDVVVETMVSNSPRKAKGKNKRYQPPRPRRFITKLRDGSQNQGASSDSEIHYWGGNNYEEEEPEFLEEVVFPDMGGGMERQTSSDSSGGDDGGTVIPNGNKKKKPKSSKRQRKKMNAAKRAMAFDEDRREMKEAWFESSYPLRATSSEGNIAAARQNQGFKEKIEEQTVSTKQNQKHKNGNDPGESTAKGKAAAQHSVKTADKDDPKTGKADVQHNSDTKATECYQNDNQDDSIPLELQDHRTNSAVVFSNDVMFELDE
ncbi:protein kintoun-like [Asterias rubens]|uniref:protein kintoun-like n=1 Tax=Asterias rubens TaxID=7604 RepID=UPI0014552549|nr:protein kintoun-like [Asterias rubens]